jgi:hypothetical protein
VARRPGRCHQHLGFGRLLLERLIEEAACRRLRVLDGSVLYDNTPMSRLLRTSGHPLEVRWDGGDVLSVKLAVAAAPGRPPLPEPGRLRVPTPVLR